MALHKTAHSRSHRLSLGLAGALVSVLLLAGPGHTDVLQYGDGTPDGKRSFGGGGHLILFDAGAEGRWLNKVEMFGSRYGTATPPDEDFHLYVIDLEGHLLRKVSLPYSLWERGNEYWRELPIPPIQVPQKFGIGLTFNAGRTKGVYVSTDSVEESHSYSWTPGSEGRGMWDVDWMVRVNVDDEPARDPKAEDLVVLKDGTAFFDRLLAAGGDPLTVETTDHGELAREDVATIRLKAIASPMETAVVVTLANGTRVEGKLLSLDENAVMIRDSTGGERSFLRLDVARLDFAVFSPKPIAPQTEPKVSARKPAWGPRQATGPPDTPRAGDSNTAWATQRENGGEEWLKLEYAKVADIAEVRVRETFNPGAASKVVAVLQDGAEAPLWEGQDPTTEAPSDFVVKVTADIAAKSVKIYLDTTRKPGWNEIDAVELVDKDGTRQWASDASASSYYGGRRRGRGG